MINHKGMAAYTEITSDIYKFLAQRLYKTLNLYTKL